PRERLVGIDGGDRDLEAAIGELADAEFAQRREAAGLEHADRTARALRYVIAHRLREEAVRRPMVARRPSFGSRHVSHSSSAGTECIAFAQQRMSNLGHGRDYAPSVPSMVTL